MKVISRGNRETCRSANDSWTSIIVLMSFSVTKSTKWWSSERSFLGASERSLQFVLNLFRNTCSTWRESSILLELRVRKVLGPHDTSELRWWQSHRSPSGMQRQFFFVRFLLFNENHISRVLLDDCERAQERVGLPTNRASKRRKVWRWPLSWEFTTRVVVILAEKGNERLSRRVNTRQTSLLTRFSLTRESCYSFLD